jgi:hypothetical protein
MRYVTAALDGRNPSRLAMPPDWPCQLTRMRDAYYSAIHTASQTQDRARPYPSRVGGLGDWDGVRCLQAIPDVICMKVVRR